DGTVYAPLGGTQTPGRFAGLGEKMSPQQVYQHIREYRTKYPDKAVVDLIGASQQQTLAFFMAGGSMLVKGMDYAREYPPEYEMPLGCESVLPIYNFVRNYLGEDLTRMRPLDNLSLHSDDPADGEVVLGWCMGKPGESYLVYMPAGNHCFS